MTCQITSDDISGFRVDPGSREKIASLTAHVGLGKHEDGFDEHAELLENLRVGIREAAFIGQGRGSLPGAVATLKRLRGLGSGLDQRGAA
jgi:hypothetical protein